MIFGAVEYTVKKGDSLSLIAKKYGRPLTDWKKIWDINQDTIKNPDKIFPGQVIQIPVSWESNSNPSPSPKPSPLPVITTKTAMGKYLLIAGVIGLAYYSYKKKWF